MHSLSPYSRDRCATLKRVCIKGKCHEVKHGKKKSKKKGLKK